ncbi:putative bifunctional methylthioribulose-1-phosphate dehydratase/enolase-phosphatase E1 2 [Apium graveolens]|uniref:putative bifunctional methylthioribulose-1-phosphate dehydratase/enolase-phosphatase E1 2 n=1 Tax=Apium graveolens TaxID=4045 RepID=UPI003D7AF150
MMENLDPQHASGQRFARLFPFSLFRRPIGPCSKRIDCNQNANTFNSKDPVYSNLETIIVKETKGLVAELCRHVYTLGWVLGTGGSITIRVHDDAISRSSQLIVMSPSGVQKDKVDPEDMFVLSSDGCILSKPRTKLYPHKPPKCTDCAPIFLKVYEMRNAGAVIHSHGIEACLVTMIHPLSKEFRITHMEMIKGIEGHGYHDELVIPIIENTAYERELTESFTKAIEAYPKTTAVLVRNHGVYIWGETWISTKTQAECYHYLFDASIKMHQLGLDWSSTGHGPLPSGAFCRYLNNGHARSKETNGFGCVTELLQGFILLDIDGTTSELRHSELVGVMFDEVPEVLERWYASGIKVYLYSSSSRGAQRLFFSNSNHGDLGEYICGYFDTTIGSKTEAKSYLEILLTIGVDKPEKILLVTSDFQAAMTARAAGLEVVISVRPGNSPIPETPNFKTIESLSQI